MYIQQVYTSVLYREGIRYNLNTHACTLLNTPHIQTYTHTHTHTIVLAVWTVALIYSTYYKPTLVQAQTGAPCLSFDILRDSLGDNRVDYPMAAYLVAGTQAEVGQQNFVLLVKTSQLKATSKDNESK